MAAVESSTVAADRQAVPELSGTARRGRLRRPGVDPLGLIGLVGLVGLWYLATLRVDRVSLPLPQDVLGRLSEEFTSSYELMSFGIQGEGYLGNLIYTTQNVLVAVALGSVAGVVVGLLSARHRTFRAMIDPIVLIGGTVPILVAAPFFLIWFGTGRSVAYLIIALYTLFTLVVFAQRAADNLDPLYEQNAQTLGASRRQVLRTVLAPGVLPEILGGVRIALAAAWGLAAIAELLGLPSGLGKVVQAYATTTDTEGIFAAILLLGVVAAITDRIVAAALRRAFRWRDA
jgi:ABC-type nitrate/sulfonate/bicarbonate transport system permease component